MKRISSIPGVRVLPYWQAPKYTPSGIREIRAIAWHMAQGGGTDTWLTRRDGAQGNNSCHIVVKYDGSIRQLVEFDDASWSLHISYDSDTNDASDFGIFGLKWVKDALGTGWTDPNRYIIAIEVEGFAADGPNAAQRKTILLLAKFLEAEFPKAVHLGHRDFQDYKTCPGKYMFINLLPHAGRLGSNEEDPMLPFRILSAAPGKVTISAGRGIVNLLDGSFEVDHDNDRVYDAVARIGLYEPLGTGDGRQTGWQVGFEGAPWIALDDVVGDGFEPAPVLATDPNPALQAELNEATNALNAIREILTDQAA